MASDQRCLARSLPRLLADLLDGRTPGGVIQPVSRTATDLTDPCAFHDADSRVELVTREAVAEPPGGGLVREALRNCASLAAATGRVLRRHATDLAPRDHADQAEVTFGLISMRVLNDVLRPALTRWHADLAAGEATRPADTAPVSHEHAWDGRGECVNDLARVHAVLVEVAAVLAAATGAADLLPAPPSQRPRPTPRHDAAT